MFTGFYEVYEPLKRYKLMRDINQSIRLLISVYIGSQRGAFPGLVHRLTIWYIASAIEIGQAFFLDINFDQ